MASYLINCVPNIDQKSYLELGVHAGATFNAVNAKYKESVDTETEHTPTHPMTTDDFFSWAAGALSDKYRWDVIYIDACHEYKQVVRDYNNAILRLNNPGGVIFLHDLVPPDESFTAPHYCGDAWRLLYQWIAGYDDPHFYTLRGDYGLTAVVGNFKPVAPMQESAPFERFLSALTQIHLYSIEEMQTILRSLPCGY